MKKITNLVVTQYRLFAPDWLPYQLLVTPFGTGIFQKALGFRQVTWSENGEYMFQDGAFSQADKTYVIPAVLFNPRRVTLQVVGDSATANEAYEAVRDAISQFWPAVRDLEPVLLTEETVCTVDLDFDWSALLNPAVAESVKTTIEGLSGPEVSYSLKHVGLRFTVVGTTESEALKGYGITFGEKTVAVEPREGVPLTERNYFAASPLGSDAHLRFVEGFERSLLKGTTPRRKQK